jgi:hypothetical protein
MSEQIYLLALRGMNEIKDFAGLDIPKLLANMDKVKVNNVFKGDELNWAMGGLIGGLGALVGFGAGILDNDRNHEGWSPAKKFWNCMAITFACGAFGATAGLFLPAEPVTP